MCAWSSLIADASSKGHLPTNSWKKEMPVKSKRYQKIQHFAPPQHYTRMYVSTKQLCELFTKRVDVSSMVDGR